MSEHASNHIVLTTTATREDAHALAKNLLEKKLFACAQIMPIESLYTWKGEMAAEAEFLLLIKTTAELVEPLQAAILDIHKYETPEVVVLPITSGSPAYLSWMTEVTA